MLPSVRAFFKTVATGFFLASFASVAQAPLDIRVALVIGNAAYKHVPPLANSVNDARAMVLVLRKLGFKVFDVIDGDRSSMSQAIGRLQADLKGQQAVAMLYYAGHGLQLDWQNYMVPIDADIDKAEDVPKQTVNIEEVIKTFKSASTRMNIIVLDACRDNPFAGSGSGKGLAQLDAPPGTYLAFATSPGNVAEDGDDAMGNGLFTHFLLKELQRPAKIEDVFKRVRLQVRQKSQGRQIPWDSSSLEDDFAFNDGQKFKFTAEDYQREIQEAKAREARLKREAEAALEREKQLAQLREQERLKLEQAHRIAEQKARERAEAELRQREQQLAEAAQAERKKSQAAQEALARAQAEELQRLKDLELARVQEEEEAQRKKLSVQAALEQQFNQEKAQWDRIKDSKNAQDYYAFLLKYPSGLIAQQATFALESLDKAKITAQADQSGLVQRSGEPRLRLGDTYVRVSKDDYTGVVIEKAQVVVERVESGLAYAKSSTGELFVYTLDGAVARSNNANGTLTFDPPRVNLPGDQLAVGMRWTGSTLQKSLDGRSVQRTDEFKILAYEDIVIPAGKFKAYKIQMKSWAGQNRVDNLGWYLPDWGVALKYQRRVYRPKGPPSMETTELESFTRGPAPQAMRPKLEPQVALQR